VMSQMNELKLFTEAFQNLDNYEEYRFKKAWGMMVILLGIMNFLPSLLEMFFSLSIFDFVNSQLFYAFLSSGILLYGIKVYLTVTRTKRQDGKLIPQSDVRFGLAFLTLWLSSVIMSINFEILESFLIAQELFLGGMGFIIAYFFLRNDLKSTRFNELLISGVFLLALSFLLALVFEIIFPDPISEDPFRHLRSIRQQAFLKDQLISGILLSSGIYQWWSAKTTFEAS
jgi:hypothetical protein